LGLPDLVDEHDRMHDQRFLEATALASRMHPSNVDKPFKEAIVPGHFVLVRAPTNASTFAPRWLGPYRVTQVSKVQVVIRNHSNHEQVVSRRGNGKLATPDSPFVNNTTSNHYVIQFPLLFLCIMPTTQQNRNYIGNIMLQSLTLLLG
jgi:hypothetical protein